MQNQADVCSLNMIAVFLLTWTQARQPAPECVANGKGLRRAIVSRYGASRADTHCRAEPP
jgi:hypothetical protein